MKFFTLALLVLVFLASCVSSHQDFETAKKVGEYLDATGIIPENTGAADKTHSGKIVYVAPGVHRGPHFTYYEVTARGDILKLKRAAEEALEKVPEVNNITLHFMEKQVWHELANGGGYRGKEKEIETIVVTRQ